jgi:hypothetical protein
MSSGLGASGHFGRRRLAGLDREGKGWARGKPCTPRAERGGYGFPAQDSLERLFDLAGAAGARKPLLFHLFRL